MLFCRLTFSLIIIPCTVAWDYAGRGTTHGTDDYRKPDIAKIIVVNNNPAAKDIAIIKCFLST